ncbi:MAG: restriction endonuclease subunit S [Candidatus Paceibacterota bacterium]
MKDIVSDSKVSWLKYVPKSWQIFRVKNLFEISNEKNLGEDIPVLSLTQRGIKIRDISNNEGQIAESYENYTRIRKNDMVFNPMDLCTGAVDLSVFDGVISLAYTTLREKGVSNLFLKYYKYYFQWHYLNEIFFPFGQGVSVDHRWTLKDDILLNFPILVPPYETQKKISDFLDKKIKVVDEIVEKKEKLIELLFEKRSSLIRHVVTKGLRNQIKMKHSGVDWIGNVPQEWNIKPLKSLFYSKKELVGTDSDKYTLLRLALDGVSPKQEGQGGKNPENYDAYQLYLPGDLVFCTFDYDVTPRTIGLVEEKGILTGAYTRLVPSSDIVSKYYYYYYLSLDIDKVLLHLCTGLRHGLSKYVFWSLANPVPPKREQKQIVDYLDSESSKINMSITLIKSQLEQLKKYRLSLIYSMVTGKIKV